MKKTKKIDFAVGGQAVIEGVMMRSPNYITVAVRKLDGSITIQDRPFISLINKYQLFKIPLVRGVINMFEMMVVGTRALNFSAQEQINDEEENTTTETEDSSAANPAKGKEPMHYQETKVTKPAKVVAAAKKKVNKSKWQSVLETVTFALSMVFALALSLFLFKFLPLWITDFLSRNFAIIDGNDFLFNLIDGLIKLTFFIAYIGIISLLPGIGRVFEYHGAEHKAIFNYEADLPLTVENSKKQSRFHPRCGTSFILIVFIISILIYTLLPREESFLLTFLERIAILPIIAGVSYEFLKFSAKKQNSKLMKLFITPGLWLQRLTTREPDETQLEVAIVSLQKALDLENKKNNSSTS